MRPLHGNQVPPPVSQEVKIKKKNEHGIVVTFEIEKQGKNFNLPL